MSVSSWVSVPLCTQLTQTCRHSTQTEQQTPLLPLQQVLKLPAKHFSNSYFQNCHFYVNFRIQKSWFWFWGQSSLHNPVISHGVVSEFTTVSMPYTSSTTTKLPVIMFGNCLWRKRNQSMPRKKEKLGVRWLKQRWKKNSKPKAWKKK